MSKGLKAEIEDNIKGKFIDVTVRLPDGKLVGIEIEISTKSEHIIEQIKKDISVGCNLVLVGFKDRKVFEQVKTIVDSLPQDIRDKTRLCILPELLKEENLFQ